MAFIQLFERSFGHDLLNARLFEDIRQVWILAEDWIKGYKAHRPHEALGGITPFRQMQYLP